MSSHAEALQLAQRLAQADDATVPEYRRALLLYWYGSGGSHLRAEADVLLSAWERHGGADHPLNAAIRAEHERLARQIASVATEPRPEAAELRRVGIALAREVHRNECELTHVVARSLEPAERIEVDRALAAFEPR